MNETTGLRHLVQSLRNRVVNVVRHILGIHLAIDDCTGAVTVVGWDRQLNVHVDQLAVANSHCGVWQSMDLDNKQTVVHHGVDPCWSAVVPLEEKAGAILL